MNHCLLVIVALGSLASVAGGCGRTSLELPGGRDAAVASGGRAAGGGGGGSGPGNGNSGGATATAGATGSGGITGTGGPTGTGGMTRTGGMTGTGGSGVVTDGGSSDAPGDTTPRPDAPGPDLPPPTPGGLACGAESCNTSTQSCCVSLGAGAVQAGCIPIGATCGGASLDCDEPADCAGDAGASSGSGNARTCCFGVQRAGGQPTSLGSRCVTRATCNGVGRFVICRTNADCGASTPVCCATAVGVPLCQRVCF